jgi:hypothetical protein
MGCLAGWKDALYPFNGRFATGLEVITIIKISKLSNFMTVRLANRRAASQRVGRKMHNCDADRGIYCAAENFSLAADKSGVRELPGISCSSFFKVGSEIMRLLAKLFRLFNSLVVISLLVIIAMVLTTISGSASTEHDVQIRQQSLTHSHLSVPTSAEVNTTRTLLY